MSRLEERRQSPGAVGPRVSVVGTVLTSGAYLLVWLAPDLDRDLTRSLIDAFFLEFFIVHAGLMVPVTRAFDRRRGLLVAAIYLLASAGVGIGFGARTFVIFLYLTAMEIVPALRAQAGELAVIALAGLGKALLYFVVIVPAMILPVPRLGISAEVESDLALSLQGVGDPGPQNVLCAAFVFFAVLAWFRGRLAAGGPPTRATGRRPPHATA